MPFIFFYFDLANVLLSHQISDFGRMKKMNDQTYPPLYTGSTTEKRLPFPSLELSSIRPPKSCTIPWQIDNPRPAPWLNSSCLKKRLNTFSCCSSDRPIPESLTKIATSSVPLRCLNPNFIYPLFVNLQAFVKKLVIT